MAVRVTPYGEHAVLVELPDLDAVHALYAALRDDLPPAVADLVPAARTLLVILDPDAGADTAAISEALQAARPTRTRSSTAAVVEVPVVYDGDDLEEVARLVGLAREEVIELHATHEYVVGFCGFLPGFAYLLGLDPRLHVPRRATPRVSVPSGAVALAGEYTAVYPRSAPGGWHLIGRTNRVLFDLGEEPPALLAPTTRVRFQPVPA